MSEGEDEDGAAEATVEDGAEVTANEVESGTTEPVDCTVAGADVDEEDCAWDASVDTEEVLAAAVTSVCAC